jgi:thioredoxin 1
MKFFLSIALSCLIVFFSITLSAETKKNKTDKNKPKPLVTFIELGSVNCIPCRMMQPVMKEIEKEYGDAISVIFYDVWQPKDKEMAAKYNIRVIPTQVFLDKNGKEFHRHEGFYPKEDIIKLVDKQLGIKKPIKSKSK